MPLITHERIIKDGELGLWQIEENEQWFLQKLALTAEEQEQLSKMKGKRRTEWLAARLLVHHMSGRTKRAHFAKDEFGKPHLLHSDHHISISHSGILAAAIASPFVVGIDVQSWTPHMERLIHKFMNRTEIQHLSSDHRLQQIHVFWGAKEALYKAYGRRALDFCRHISLDTFEYLPQGGRTTGRIMKKEYAGIFSVAYRMVQNYMLVYVVKQ